MNYKFIKGEENKMVEVLLKFPEDLRGILKGSDILAEKSELKEGDIDELDHLIKEELFKRIKEVE
jgi:hypothetical protein